ncbi:MAG: tRNA pseudouridine(55) synthase TruB [Bacteroidales bacterium]|nr:tRNA pseudouridine(55) synthase TruB [Bacteroidales bacterium]
MTLDQLQAGVVLPIDKPRQWTSFQVIGKIKAILRHQLGIKNIKIGHAGTLDPLASGLLLVCIGRATKSIPTLQDADKTYTGTFLLGATTPCFDLEQPIDHYYPYLHLTLPQLQSAAASFLGQQQQVPPAFSAVKVDGQRAYQLAREEGFSPALQAKPITIHQFDITAFRPGQPFPNPTQPTESTQPAVPSQPQPPLSSRTPHPSPQKAPHLYNNPLGQVPSHLPQADFLIRCSKGTYIRSIARDLGLALQSGALLAALRREQIGPYSISQALSLDQIENTLLE